MPNPLQLNSTPQLKLHPNPFVQFHQWYQEAVQRGIHYPDAMTLATATPTGIPSARIVLYKGMYREDGIQFFTNYKSRKGKELATNPRAALLFYWPELRRQLRIEGRVRFLPREESNQYWNTRPIESRINAVASPQSQKIRDRKFLLKRVEELNRKHFVSPSSKPISARGKLKSQAGLTQGNPADSASSLKIPNPLLNDLHREDLHIPRPEHWGGYYLVPNKFEFWIEGQFRLHDRFEYVKRKGKWSSSRLAP